MHWVSVKNYSPLNNLLYYLQLKSGWLALGVSLSLLLFCRHVITKLGNIIVAWVTAVCCCLYVVACPTSFYWDIVFPLIIFGVTYCFFYWRRGCSRLFASSLFLLASFLERFVDGAYSNMPANDQFIRVPCLQEFSCISGVRYLQFPKWHFWIC